MFRTGNPALKADSFESVAREAGGEAMTIEGTVNKTGTSLLVLLACASLQWNAVFGEDTSLELIPDIIASHHDNNQIQMSILRQHLLKSNIKMCGRCSAASDIPHMYLRCSKHSKAFGFIENVFQDSGPACGLVQQCTLGRTPSSCENPINPLHQNEGAHYHVLRHC